MIFQKSACIETLYTELPFLERFRAAKADGFDFVEFWSWTAKDLAAVKAAADAAGIGISGFNDWNKMIERAMTQDFSWMNSARQYEDLYRSLIGE